MRFLVFNIMAGLAIAYLAFGGGDNPVTRFLGNDSPAATTAPDTSSSQHQLEAQLEEAQAALETFKDMPERLAALEDENADLQLALDVIGSQASEAIRQDPVQEQAPAQEPTQLQAMAGSTEPAIEEEVLTAPETPQEAATTEPAQAEANLAQIDTTEAPVLLTPKERRRELQLLSQDLEELYIKSLN